MGKKGYALVEAVTAVALVMMASGILSLGISFGLRMERRAEQLKDTDTVQEVPARFRMRTWDGTVISGVSYRITCNNGNQRTLINP